MPTHPEPDIAADVIVIPANRPKLARQCLNDVLCIGVFILLLEACYLRILRGNWLVDIGLLGFLFFGARFVGVFSRYLFNCPALVLTREGIQDGSYFTIFPLIRWQAIQKIVTTSHPLRALQIFVQDAPLLQPRSGFNTISLGDALEERPLFTMSKEMLPGTVEELLQQIQSYCTDYHIGEHIEFVRERAEP
jgi:hypothetical protein